MIDRNKLSNDANVMLDAAIEVLGNDFIISDNNDIVYWKNQDTVRLIIHKQGCISLHKIKRDSVGMAHLRSVSKTITSYEPIVSSVRIDDVKKICEIFKEIL